LSRLGKIAVAVPHGVQVKIDGRQVEVKGSKGALSRQLPPEIKAEVKEGKVHFAPAMDGEKVSALWGLYRVLVANMITGVSQGYRKELEIVGVGYKAEMKGKDLQISVGYAKPVLVKAARGITYSVDNQTKITIEGCDKELVGQSAADLRKIKPPEPYKGKGIMYAGERIRRKAGKIAGK
jgi:large subunit ribosomal protein L6